MMNPRIVDRRQKSCLIPKLESAFVYDDVDVCLSLFPSLPFDLFPPFTFLFFESVSFMFFK